MTTLSPQLAMGRSVQRRHRILSHEQKALILSLFAAGQCVKEIARQLDVPSRSAKQKKDMVYMLLRREGLSIRGTPNAARPETRVRLPHAEILRLYLSGLGAPAVAARVGCGTTSVNKIAAQAGVLRKQTGRTIQHGYAKVKINGRYIPEHRVVMERHLGRPLEPGDTVHHINGNGLDNRIENLQIRKGKHGKGVVYRCRDCGSHNVEAVPISDERHD